MAVENQLRMAEVERARTGFLAFKDRYDKAAAELEELRALSAELKVDTVKELAALLKEKNIALEYEKKLNADRHEELEALADKLVAAEKKTAEAEDALLDAQEESRKQEVELNKTLSDLKSAQTNHESEKQKWEADRLQYEAREKELKAENAKLATEKADLEGQISQLKPAAAPESIPLSVANAFQEGFEACQDQITRKFPNHGIDFNQLDVLEESESEEGDGEEENAEEGG